MWFEYTYYVQDQCRDPQTYNKRQESFEYWCLFRCVIDNKALNGILTSSWNTLTTERYINRLFFSYCLHWKFVVLLSNPALSRMHNYTTLHVIIFMLTPSLWWGQLLRLILCYIPGTLPIMEAVVAWRHSFTVCWCYLYLRLQYFQWEFTLDWYLLHIFFACPLLWKCLKSLGSCCMVTPPYNVLSAPYDSIPTE